MPASSTRRLAKGPKLPFDYQVNSTRHFMRELNRLGVTGAIDAGGGFQNYPEDYAVIQKLSEEGQLTIRLAYNLFTQKPKGEKEDFLNWTKTSKYKQGDDYFRHNGAGEMLVFSAADFEDFRAAAPGHAAGDGKRTRRRRAHPCARTAGRGGFMRPMTKPSHARSTCSRRVNQDMPLERPELVLRSRRDDLRRIDRPHCGARRRHRRAAPHGLSGRVFRRALRPRRRRSDAADREMLAEGLKVSAGTDATRVASYNPWVSLAWLVTGKTVAGMQLYPQRNCLDRETALRMWTENVTWFSNEEGKKGRIKVGQLADLIVPDRDYFSCADDEIADITSELTVVGGKVVYGAGDFAALDESALPPAMPDWSPVRTFGGYAAWGDQEASGNSAQIANSRCSCGCANACNIHGHDHAAAWSSKTADRRSESLLGRARLRLLGGVR